MDFRPVLCAAVVALSLSPGTGAAAAVGEPTVRIAMNKARLITVKVANTADRAICIPYNYGSGARISATARGRVVVNHQNWEGRPPLGCRDLAAGQTLEFTYDGASLFPELPDGAIRLCYRLPWIERTESGEALRSSPTCVTV